MIGTRLAHYEITAHLGSGGMGDVYQATDSKLGRSVAVKFLTNSFSHDADRVARFEREARLLASINHPNIAAIYGLESANEKKFLVMELVPGDTLADKIKRGPIPIEEALTIAKQIAEALEAAHEKGIIHRDLKPANIKVTSDDRVKVLDFGLAKAYEQDSSNAALSHSPTMSMAATNAGMILGTAAYMSPEQAVGKPLDKRSDLWSFGVVLLEMLTGRQMFHGETVSHLLASVLKDAPDWTTLPASTPAAIRRLLRRCLEKDRRKRLADAADVRLEIEDALTALTAPEEATAQQAVSPSSSLSSRGTWIVAVASLVVIAALAIPAVRHLRETPPPETRLDIVTPSTESPTAFALSPDGRQIVFVASGDGMPRLWLRSLASTTAQPLAGTEGASLPFWSPDSRSIAFFAGSALKRIDLGGGVPQTLAPALSGTGGTWNADGVILFAPTVTSPLMRVPSNGGATTVVTKFGPQQSGHTHPWFLPDGKHFLFHARGGPDAAGIYLSALEESTPTRLTSTDTAGTYLPSLPLGMLVWVRMGTLVVQPLDIANAKLTGEPITLADGVADDERNRAGISVSSSGLLAYRTGESNPRQLTWVDRNGKVQGTVGQADSTYLNPEVASDGHRVVVSRMIQGNLDVWALDGPRMSRITIEAAADFFPLWSPDGTRIVFRSNRTGAGDLYLKLASGAGSEELLLASDQLKTPTGWSADGRFLMYMSNDPQTGMDLWVLPMDGDRKPFVFLKTPFREAYGAFSPNGQWVAYQSNVSGRPEIYLRPFIAPGARPAAETTGADSQQQQVSTTGGISPLWRSDGKELYYLNYEGALMSVPLTIKGSAIEQGAPVQLFRTRISGSGVDAQQGRQYSVAPDGRFLVNMELPNAAGPITLIQNWAPAAAK